MSAPPCAPGIRPLPVPRDALEGEGPQRRPRRPLDGGSEDVAEAVGGRLLSVTNTIEVGTWRQGDGAWAWAGRPGGGGGYLPPLPMPPCPSHPPPKVCPPGIEATVFAMLAGFANFGAILAGYIGAYVLTLLGLDQVGKGTHDDFSQAWKACLLSGCASLVPLLVLLPFMIPSASMEADLVHEEGLLPHPLDPLETSIYGEYRDYGALGDSRRGSAVALRPESGPAGAEGQGTRGPAEGAC